MARVPLLDPEDPDIEPKGAALLRLIQESGMPVGTGSPLKNIARAMAHHPELMESFFGFVGAAGGPPYAAHLTPKESELAYLTSARVLECFY